MKYSIKGSERSPYLSRLTKGKQDDTYSCNITVYSVISLSIRSVCVFWSYSIHVLHRVSLWHDKNPLQCDSVGFFIPTSEATQIHFLTAEFKSKHMILIRKCRILFPHSILKTCDDEFDFCTFLFIKMKYFANIKKIQ